MALDPNIILKAANPAIDVGGIMQLREVLGARRAAEQDAERGRQAAAAKQVRLGQIGSIAATGDYAGAQKAALQAGDFDLVEHVNKLDDRSKATLAAKVDAAAPVFATALEEPDLVKRGQIIAAAFPTLKANGYSDDELTKINPSNEFLRGAVANAQKISDIVKHQEFIATEAGKAEDRTLRREDQRLDRENSRGNAYISAGLLPPDAGGVGAGMGGGAGGGPRGDVSRLINTDAGGGYVPDSVQTLGQFVDFGKDLNRRGAKSSSAGTYQINGTTMRDFAPRVLGPNWQSAPFNADSQEAVGKAIFDWAKQQPNPAAALRGRWVSLSPAEARQAVQGDWQSARGMIAAGETGGAPGASAAAPAGGLRIIPGGKLDKSGEDLSTSALERAAIVYGTTGQMPQGLGRAGVTQKAILNKWDEIASKGGTSAQEQVANWQSQKAAGKAVQAFASGPQGNTVRSLNVAVDHLDTLQNAAQALQNGNVQLFNRVAQKIGTAFGRTAPTNFEAIRGIVGDEITKAVIGGGSAGALADREEMKRQINAAQSPQQLAGVIAEFKKLMGGQLSGLRDQYRSSTGRDDFDNKLSSRTRVALGLAKPGSRGTLSANIPTMTPEQARSAPKGTRFKTVDGRVMVRQ